FPAAPGTGVVLFDLYSSIEPRRMRIERPPGHVTSRCTAPRAEGGFSCPSEAEWLYLAQRSLLIERRLATCVWAHPTTGGAIVFELPPEPRPPPGRSLELRLSAALSDDAAEHTSDGAPVRTAIVQAGAEKGSVTVQNQVGWFRAEVKIE